MEGLIIGLVVMALAALFNQKKTDEETTRPKNPMQTARQQTVKRAEDYAKEIYGGLQTQRKEQPERSKQIGRRVEEAVTGSRMRGPEQKQERPVRERPVRETGSRLTADQSRSAPAPTPRKTADNLFSLEKEDLKKSIILSEILMPPKSKRK